MNMHYRKSRRGIEWTEAMKQALARHINDGLSLGAAAKAMGLNRNQIAGKAHRLGLKTKTECRYPPPKKETAERTYSQSWEGEFPPGTGIYPDSLKCQWLEGDVPGNAVKFSPSVRGGRLVLPANAKRFGPVYPSWADVPRCTEERVPGRPYCHAHCLRAYDLASVARMEARK